MCLVSSYMQGGLTREEGNLTFSNEVICTEVLEIRLFYNPLVRCCNRNSFCAGDELRCGIDH